MVFPARGSWLVLLLVASLLTPTVALAQGEGPTDDEVNEIASELYCPVCENIPLDVCGTQACIQWRALIRERLAAGWSEQEIKQMFVEQYGDRVLATPPARGFNWLVYVLPPLALLVGAGVLVSVIRAWRRPPEPPGDSAQSESFAEDPYVAELEQQLRAREGGSTGDRA